MGSGREIKGEMREKEKRKGNRERERERERGER